MTDEKTMEQEARDRSRQLEREVEAYIALQNEDEDVLYDEDRLDGLCSLLNWAETDDALGECTNCGKRFSEHPWRDVRGNEVEDACEEFEPDWDTLRDQAEERIDGWNYGEGVSIVVDVQMYGGGPAGGIEFECEREEYGLSMLRARVWHQDWFKERGYWPLSDDVAEALFQRWGLEYAAGEG